MKQMKKISIAVVLMGLLWGASTAQAGQDGWMTDYDKALNKAKSEGKLLLVEFHGSDWCPPCIKLQQDVLSQDAFKALADAALVLVDADFPRKIKLSPEQKTHNDELARKFGVQYFPTVLILNSEGEVLDKMVGFPKGGLDGFLKFVTDQTRAGS